MVNNRKKHKGKKRLKFRHIYALIMLLVTAYFAWHVVDLLVFAPNRDRGVIALGYRMDEIQPLEESWINATETFGATLGDVDYVSIFWNSGPVVYVSVRVHPGTMLDHARSAATEVVEHFIAVSNDVVLQYNIQVVVSYGDTTAQMAENQAALIQFVHEYNHGFAERTLAWAEQYPSQANFERARYNINNRFTTSIREVVGEGGLQTMRVRLDAIEVVDQMGDGYGYIEYEDTEYGNEDAGDEAEDTPTQMPSYPGVLQIPQSHLTDFPNWGTWNNEHSRIIWNERDGIRPSTDDECLDEDECPYEEETETDNP